MDGKPKHAGASVWESALHSVNFHFTKDTNVLKLLHLLQKLLLKHHIQFTRLLLFQGSTNLLNPWLIKEWNFQKNPKTWNCYPRWT